MTKRATDEERAGNGLITEPIPITTTFDFPGWTIDRWVGPVFGLVVRSMGWSNSFVAGFRSLAQTEMVEYTKLLEDSRRQAIDRLVEHAMMMGANGIVGMRFDSSNIGGQFAEIVAYGTAVIVSADTPDHSEQAGAPDQAGSPDQVEASPDQVEASPDSSGG